MRKKRKPKKQRKIIPLNTKTLGNDITKYPYVEIEWVDIEGDAGWSSTKQLNLEQLPVTRIFTDYIKSKDKPTFEDIGNTTIIPTAVIKNIKKIL
jgi:hypothetical protein